MSESTTTLRHKGWSYDEASGQWLREPGSGKWHWPDGGEAFSSEPLPEDKSQYAGMYQTWPDGRAVNYHRAKRHPFCDPDCGGGARLMYDAPAVAWLLYQFAR